MGLLKNLSIQYPSCECFLDALMLVTLVYFSTVQKMRKYYIGNWRIDAVEPEGEKLGAVNCWQEFFCSNFTLDIF